MILTQDDQMVNIVVRGLIFYQGHLLLTQWKDKGYCFPIGGRVEHGEIIEMALEREVLEETGAEAIIKKLLYFNEHFFTAIDTGMNVHEYGWFFLVELSESVMDLDEVMPNPDDKNLVNRYVHVDTLSHRIIYPSFLAEFVPLDYQHSFSHNPRHIISRQTSEGTKIQESRLFQLSNVYRRSFTPTTTNYH